ncbi:winged helix-turn-helix domain-containing protein [Psychromonas ossibalaenae]|uniref:winged helix-turn-helix domain-containing protein n=1 Tax=Psychromonas ossibalaenae TaxID=444922 RepID=UPI00035F5DE8|nr:winged helix-turn-helix domain-containing protein [Psychromonas ossibalaenae]
MTVKIKIEHHTLCLHDKKIQLPHSEIKILRLLLLQAGKVVEREDLLKIGWPDRVVSNNTLSVAIKSLRRKLLELGVESSITTVPSRGYYIEAEILPAYFSLVEGFELDSESLAVINKAEQADSLDETDNNLQDPALTAQVQPYRGWFYKHIIALIVLLFLILVLANKIYSPFSSIYFCDDSPDKVHCKLTDD